MLPQFLSVSVTDSNQVENNRYFFLRTDRKKGREEMYCCFLLDSAHTNGALELLLTTACALLNGPKGNIQLALLTLQTTDTHHHSLGKTLCDTAVFSLKEG